MATASFRTKLFLAALSTALIALVVAGLLFARSMRIRTDARLEQTLVAEARLAAELLAGSAVVTPDSPLSVLDLAPIARGGTASSSIAASVALAQRAEEHGFLVIYPAQAANANGSRCWNWFRPEDQDRGSGEPSIIAGITREVASGYRVDARRIFVAGLSAGAAMAVILGRLYPELYAAVGVHSGLPYASAHDVPSAFAAMKGGAASRARTDVSCPTPAIVFHGDRDRTVSARNAEAIVQELTTGSEHCPVSRKIETGTAQGGRSYSRAEYLDPANQSVVEHWTVHGAGHAWSGGSREGTYTDPTGPDASAEMVRFFLSRPRAGTS